MKTVIFIALLAISLSFFARTMWLFGRAVAKGRPDPRPRLDQLPARIASVLIYFFGQKKVAEEGPLHQTSKHHLFIFWGFLVITLGTADLFVSGMFPSLSLHRLPGLLAHPIYLTIDVFNLIVLLMICWAVTRRVFVKPKLIPWNLDAALILGAIGSLMVTHFMFHGYQIAGEVAAGHGYPIGEPISGAVARWLGPIDPGAAHRGATLSYWTHVLIVLTFLNYLPYSKHIHLLGALPNIFTRNLSTRTLDMPKLDLEDETQWGVGKFEQFSWKSLLDTYACTECARCSNYCPAYGTGKNLSPMQLVHDIRYEMLDRVGRADQIVELEQQAADMEAYVARGGGDDPHHPNPDLAFARQRVVEAKQALEDMPLMTGGRIAEDTLWACTTCGACQEVCPVFIEHPLKIIQMRQNLVLEQEKVPAELGRAFRNIERQSNPWGIANDKRMEWAEGLEVPTLEDNPDPEWILWVGCAGAFDARIIKQTRAMVKVLDAAGVDWAVLGHAEGCTGDPARRAGNEMLFQMLAEQNVETLNSSGAKKVLTSCPHCLHTLRHDYPQFGGDFEVVHHTQLIARLIADGALKPEPATIETVTYHDSCYLGRWNKEFDAPRDIITSLQPAGAYTEMARSKRHGFCCGAGGGRMFMEEHGERVNVNRTEEIIATGAQTVAVACPFCNIMVTDGMKQLDQEGVEVLDVAELVARAVPDVPVSALTRKKQARGES
ncbi:MAG: 4Fe-4S dicluster domain-containing protein [Kofleriaceae bacterium]|nr:4Fe-4S dicluster domain-containing protein [Myxococcales bacterium]MCB9563632.1 4Fe-4S dicluster domain-containing protein [Kofleriaceae bacterium]MCB9572875.1 4Fe-4S dicluster domain-containing protein [Kofleriaceae bacterium]